APDAAVVPDTAQQLIEAFRCDAVITVSVVARIAARDVALTYQEGQPRLSLQPQRSRSDLQIVPMRELLDVSGFEPSLQLAEHLVLINKRVDQPLGNRLFGEE